MTTLGPPLILVDIECTTVEQWLNGNLPTWATRIRQKARSLAPGALFVLTVDTTLGTAGFLLFDRAMGHLHYIETRADVRNRGVAGELWERLQDEITLEEITATGETEDGRACLEAWGFTTDGSGFWTWNRGVTGGGG